MKIFLLAILVLLFDIVSANESDVDFRIVQTNYGSVRGLRNDTLFKERSYFSFRGIPYAKPPIGALRFKPPVTAEGWATIRNAYQYGQMCIQVNRFTGEVRGYEDCLYLNVFVPDVDSKEKLPVMFFIHGGAYIFGSSNGYGPDFLVNNNVILVTINYRLGPFGFLSLGTTEYSGNMGLKDQSLALKWVNENIEYFGGDKTKITIFGESAGSGSVHLHTFSPLSKGLFHRAIMQSGVGINPWAVYSKSSHIEQVKKLEVDFGQGTGKYDVMVKLLQDTAPYILAKEWEVNLFIAGAARRECDLLWAPVIEVSGAKDAFLTEHPNDILKQPSNDNIDTFFGFTSAEMYTLSAMDLYKPELLKPFHEKFELQLPKKYLTYDYESKEYKQIAKDIRKFYFGKNGQVNEKSLFNFMTMMSDVWFVYGIHEAAILQAQRSSGKTYLYQLSTDSQINRMKTISGAYQHNLPGTAHADDLFYVFRIHDVLFDEPPSDVYENLTPDSNEAKLIESVSKLWTNFAKYGTPTLPTDSINFKPIENNVINYGDITNDGLLPGVNPFQENMKFWNGLYKKYAHAFKDNIYAKDEL